MNNINFDQGINRSNTASLKWDFTEQRFGEKDLLPMWVADMDFASPPEIVNALTKRAMHPVYGYTAPTDLVYDSSIKWMKNKHNWDIKREWITFSAGVVSGFTTAILAFSEPGDKVLIQTPVYTPFFDSVKSNNRVLVENPLNYVEGTLKIDFDDLESQLQDNVKIFLLCNPHNPGGMVWSREDLKKIGELCVKHNVLIISDEIHADLCLPGFTHYPIASLSKEISDITITLMAPSKTFNVAGIQASLLICENKKLQQKLNQTQHQLAFHGLNLFALEVITAAYDHCDYWLEEVIQYIQKNVETVHHFIQEELPQIKMVVPEASYLIWLDCTALGLSDQELRQQLIHKGKIAVSPGYSYGKGGEGFIRLNVGCTHQTVLEGLKRLKLALS